LYFLILKKFFRNLLLVNLKTTLKMIDTPYLALLHAFRRMRILHGLDKFSIFEEYKEWIVDDYKCNSIIFIKEEHII